MTAPIGPVCRAFWRACDDLVLHHVPPWELDEALTAWGYTMGPCEARDLVGLDTVLTACDGQTGPVLPRMVAEGRLGKRAGWGFYRYPGGGGAVIDPLLDDLVAEEAHFAGIKRNDLSADEIVTRLHRDLGAALKADRQAAVTQLHFPVDGFDRLP